MNPELIVVLGFLIMAVLVVALLICANERERLLQHQETSFSNYYNRLLDLSRAAEQQQLAFIKKLEEELEKSQAQVAAYRNESSKK